MEHRIHYHRIEEMQGTEWRREQTGLDEAIERAIEELGDGASIVDFTRNMRLLLNAADILARKKELSVQALANYQLIYAQVLAYYQPEKLDCHTLAEKR